MCRRFDRTVNSLVSMCSSFVTRAVEEFALACTVWFLVSVLTTLVAIPVTVSLFDWLFTFAFAVVSVSVTFVLAFLPLATFTVQGVNINRHKIWKIRFSNLLCGVVPSTPFQRTGSHRETVAHGPTSPFPLCKCTCRYVRTSFGDREIHTATSTSSCSGALAVLLYSSVAFSQSFIRCKNCSLVPKSHPRISFSNAKPLDLVFG